MPSTTRGFNDLGFAKVEVHRDRRQGFPEAIYCPGKTTEQIVAIFAELLTGDAPVIATRINPEAATAVLKRFPEAVHHPVARLVCAQPRPRRDEAPELVIAAGTADLPVAEEAAVTLETLGKTVERLFDVGVAGLHRLMEQESKLRTAKVAVVCAGMEGALPSVVGGLA